MKNRLCSVNYNKFFCKIDKVGLSVEGLLDLIRDNMYLIADDIMLGKLEIKFEATDMSGDKVLFLHSDGFEQEGVVQEYVTQENRRVTFLAHSVKGHLWSDKDRQEIIFLCKNIFVLCGRAKLSEIIEKNFFKDPGTGIANLKGFMFVGNNLIKQGTLNQYVAMFINLKNFKYISSKIGGRYGDAVIKEYAGRLSDSLRKDEFVARLGGDNFTLLIKKERKDEVLEFLTCVNLEMNYQGVKSYFDIKAWIGTYDIESDDSMSHIMDCISAAMSVARRNRIHDIVAFNQDTLNKMTEEQEILSIFPDALENKEFVVYYQPKVRLDTNELCGGEALVRWMRNGKLVFPGDFIPVLERNGKVCALDFYVLEQACSDIKRWKDNGIEPTTISINFSKTHLQDHDIAAKILSVIQSYGIESRYIEIELTEMSDYSDYNLFKDFVTVMKNNGIVTSMDDFGTGYSSLNLLTDFMFDIVKLDKSFLDNIEKHNSKKDEIVLRNIVKMVNELNLIVIAEGVETEEQAEFLKKIGCNMVQGYLYDKPLCEEQFEERLKKRKYNRKTL